MAERESYSHPEHGQIEWHHAETRTRTIEGWLCTRCKTLAPEDDPDDVFDSHDCDRWKEIGERVTGKN